MLLATIIVISTLLLLLLVSRLFIVFSTRQFIKNIEDLRKTKHAVVFGAGLRKDGAPTLILNDRVQTGANLIKELVVEKLLMTGSTAPNGNSEPIAMKCSALRMGVSENAIVLDHQGTRTFSSCERAGRVYNIQDAVIVTQRFHLPRALYISRKLGIQVQGVCADIHHYKRAALFYWHIREIPASLIAIIDCELQKR
jgi:SanA protein